MSGYQTRPQTCSPPECLSKAHPSYPFMVSSEELDTKRQYDGILNTEGVEHYEKFICHKLRKEI